MRQLPGSAVLERFCAACFPGPEPETLIVAAHPDDEVVGAGARLNRLRAARILHLTDGAPRDEVDARAAGFADLASYSAARSRELLQALGLAGVGADRVASLGLADQSASTDLTGLSLRLAEAFLEYRPEIVVTHPYEGGHPDHDAAAFAVHAARALLHKDGLSSPALLEFTSYHAGPEGMATSRFLDGRGSRVLVLSAEERRLKESMLACFATQQRTLAWFPVGVEAFRVAPAYDFTRPPHLGRLWYEWFGWGGIDGNGWRQRAASALTDLGLRGRL